MYQEAPEPLEQRLSELQSQIDRLSVALHLWQDKQDHLQPMERRLLRLTEQCEEMVGRWAATDERHARAVGELEDRVDNWQAVETRVQRETSERLVELQRGIEREWQALRRIHEEPARQLREQASTLTEVSVAAASSALSGFERAEARLAELEAGLHRRLTELSEQVRAAAATPQTPGLAATPTLPGTAGPGPAWPLEGVVRLHNQLRESNAPAVDPDGPAPARTRRRLPEAPAPLAGRLDTLEQAVSESQAEIRSAVADRSRGRRLFGAALAATVLGLALAGVAVAHLQKQVGAAAVRADEAEQRAKAATESATQQIEAARTEAAREIAQARDAAFRAQTIGNVLAAPDLVRYNLAGRDAAALAGAQALWSRSRGFVFSGSRLPPLRDGLVYQVWLLTNAEPVSAGVFVPDQAGRATLAVDNLPQIPRPVGGVAVTMEPAGGGASPSSAAVLARAP